MPGFRSADAVFGTSGRGRQKPPSPQPVPNPEDHLGLARWMAAKMIKRDGRPIRGDITDTDEYADGLLGLMEAVKRYDPGRGYKFATYATYWVFQAIQRGRQMRGEKAYHGRESLPSKRRATVFQFSQVKLDDDGEVRSFDDLLAGPEDEVAAEGGEHHLHRLWRLLDLLRDDRQRRFVFKKISGVTLVEIAEEETPPVSKERVRQVILQALKILRNALKCRGITNAQEYREHRHIAHPA